MDDGERIKCWMDPAEIQLILENLDSSQVMLEWGMGGSTLLFAPRVRSYYCVEHDPAWYGWMTPRLAANTTAVLREPAWPYTPYDAAEEGQFTDYRNAIHAFAVPHFDVVLVDGRARVACVLEAAQRMRGGSKLFFHDFWLRKRYHGSIERIERHFQLVAAIQSTKQTLALFEKT